MKKIIFLLGSLKAAVLILLSLAGALAIGTFIESYYDTPTASYWVYRAFWFRLFLFAFALNILCVTITRWPWKKKHIPFLTAHLGILILLFGSMLTQKFGIDGTMKVSEGESSSLVQLDENFLFIRHGESIRTIPMPWIPPHVDFKEIYIKDLDLRITRYLTHAETVFDFKEGDQPTPALKLKLEGGPMQMKQEFWIWAGDPTWSQIDMGPARFVLHKEDQKKPELKEGQATVVFVQNKDGSLKYQAVSKRGEVQNGLLTALAAEGAVINPGWAGVKIQVLKYIRKAINNTYYAPARVQYGQDAPTSALYLMVGKGGLGSELWMGLGDTAVLDSGGMEIQLAYSPRQVMLPFGLHLDRFHIGYDPGSMSPASYSSDVKVTDSGSNTRSATISMNEPLEYKGYTVYQASYIPAEPRPVTSVFSVNQDPGRSLKYWGSILIVLGSVLLFAAKYKKK